MTLTARGRRTANQVKLARLTSLTSVLQHLTPDERKTLQALLAKVMATIVDEKNGGPWICRLCDLEACGRDEDECPTANAARAKYG